MHPYSFSKPRQIKFPPQIGQLQIWFDIYIIKQIYVDRGSYSSWINNATYNCKKKKRHLWHCHHRRSGNSQVVAAPLMGAYCRSMANLRSSYNKCTCTGYLLLLWHVELASSPCRKPDLVRRGLPCLCHAQTPMAKISMKRVRQIKI